DNPVSGHPFLYYSRSYSRSLCGVLDDLFVSFKCVLYHLCFIGVVGYVHTHHLFFVRGREYTPLTNKQLLVL
ncbi:MAG: hypothetical protein WCT48_06060, partial [Candidatus Paceibacterota bacterium]